MKKKGNLILLLAILTACSSDSIKENKAKEIKNVNWIDQNYNKRILFKDFDFFELTGKSIASENSNVPLIKIDYDIKGRIIRLQDSLGGSLGASPLIFNYSSKLVTAKLQSTEEGAYVNIIFADSVMIALYSYKGYIETMKQDAFFLNEVHVLRKNLTEDVYYFRPKKLIVKSELDFKFEYLDKYDRKDSKVYNVDMRKLQVNTKSTLEEENKLVCYDCDTPFSLYWWFFYESLIYQEATCTQ